MRLVGPDHAPCIWDIGSADIDDKLVALAGSQAAVYFYKAVIEIGHEAAAGHGLPQRALLVFGVVRFGHFVNIHFAFHGLQVNILNGFADDTGVDDYLVVGHCIRDVSRLYPCID